MILISITEGVTGNSEVVAIGGSIDVPNSPKLVAIGGTNVVVMVAINSV